MTRPPLAHKVIIPRPYVPACATDIRVTIAHARARIGTPRIIRVPALLGTVTPLGPTP